MIKRADELMSYTNGSPEESEMEVIAEAVERYAASVQIQNLAANDDIKKRPPAPKD